MTKIRLHIAQTQIPPTNPIINDASNGMETLRVTAFDPRLKTAQDEEVTMDQFMQKRREQQPAIVFRVLENRLREHDERLNAIAVGTVAQGSGADEFGLIPFFRRPIPLHASGQHAAEEDRVGGCDDAGEGFVVDDAVVEGVVELDEAAENAFVESAFGPPVVRHLSEVVFDSPRGLLVAES